MKDAQNKVKILMQLFGYNIGNIIGKGGMATVYRTEHILLKQERALKVMSPELTNQPGFKESFIREGQFVATLRHPNIVTIYDISEQNGIYFMAMEYLHGGSLENKLPLSLNNAIKVLKQIGSALYYAHQQKIIHRDIKPANILFNAQGDAILTDFGISKIEDTDSDLTRMGYGVVGTARYMSPEQTGGEKLDHRSDLYSFALLFYEILSGEKAIKANTQAAIMREHAVAPPPTLPTEYSFLQTVLNKALAKKANQRYPDIRAFVEAVVIEKTKHEIMLKAKKDQQTLLMRVSAFVLLIVAVVITIMLNIENGEKIKAKAPLFHPNPMETKSLTTISPLNNMPKEKLSSEKRGIEEPSLNIAINASKIDLHQSNITPLPTSNDNDKKNEVLNDNHKKDEVLTDTIAPKPPLPIKKEKQEKILADIIQAMPIKKTDNINDSKIMDYAKSVSDKEIPKVTKKAAETIQPDPIKKADDLNIKQIDPVSKIVRVSPYIFIYEQPNKKRIGQLQQGAPIKVTAIAHTDTGKSWSRITFNGKQAYVKTSQLK